MSVKVDDAGAGLLVRLFGHVFAVRSPVMLTAHAWRYAIRQRGWLGALMHRGFA
jgi:hypothetical protein